jgi:hypothetical protein
MGWFFLGSCIYLSFHFTLERLVHMSSTVSAGSLRVRDRVWDSFENEIAFWIGRMK